MTSMTAASRNGSSPTGRKAADDVRHQWPRTGKILDQIAASYEAGARREDVSAEWQVRR